MGKIRVESPNYVLGLTIFRDHRDGITANQLQEQMKITKRNVLQYIKIWRSEHKVYIGTWARPPGGQGDWVPVYMLKPSPFHHDTPKPAPKSPVQRQREYRQRHRAAIKARKLLRSGKKDAYDRLIMDLMK